MHVKLFYILLNECESSITPILAMCSYITTELKHINNNGKLRASSAMFQLTSVPVLSDVVFIFFSSIVVLTPNGNFWVMPLLYSVSNIYRSLCSLLYAMHYVPSSSALLYIQLRCYEQIFLP